MSNYEGGLSDYTVERRFERMENKIDALVNAVTELVKAEVVMKNMEVRLNSHADELNKLDARLAQVEHRIPIYELSSQLLGRLALLVLTLVVAGVIGGLFVVTT